MEIRRSPIEINLPALATGRPHIRVKGTRGCITRHLNSVDAISCYRRLDLTDQCVRIRDEISVSVTPTGIGSKGSKSKGDNV